MAFSAWLTHPDNPAVDGTITATTEAASYPATNLQSLPTTTRWRSTTVASAQDIEVDLGSAQSVDLIALVNHNLTSGASIVISAGTTTGYLEFSSVTMTWREFLAFKWLSTPESYRYWRIRITDASNADSYLAVGYLVLGGATLPTFQFRQGWITSPNFVSFENRSPYGVTTVDEIHRYQMLRMDFGPLTAAEMTVLRAAYTAVEMDANPLILLPERDGEDAYFGRFTTPLDETSESAQFYTSLAFEEDSYGNRR